MSILFDTAYQEGLKAGINGENVEDNPYSSPESGRNSFLWWFAGWCNGKRSRNKAEDSIKEKCLTR